MNEGKKKCSNCDYAVLDDFGYSNFTVEGETVYCSKGLHPDQEFDRWYGEDKRDLFAEKCSEFASTEGPVQIDCEREGAKMGVDYSDPNAWAEYATKFVDAATIAKVIT